MIFHARSLANSKSLNRKKRNLFTQQKSPKKYNFLKPGNLFRKCLLRWQDISLCLVHIILKVFVFPFKSLRIRLYWCVLVPVRISSKGKEIILLLLSCHCCCCVLKTQKNYKISFKELPFC